MYNYNDACRCKKCKKIYPEGKTTKYCKKCGARLVDGYCNMPEGHGTITFYRNKNVERVVAKRVLFWWAVASEKPDIDCDDDARGLFDALNNAAIANALMPDGVGALENLCYFYLRRLHGAPATNGELRWLRSVYIFLRGQLAKGDDDEN